MARNAGLSHQRTVVARIELAEDYETADSGDCWDCWDDTIVMQHHGELWDWPDMSERQLQILRFSAQTK